VGTRSVELPDELLDLLRTTHLGSRSEAEQVRVALAIHLFIEEVVSIGKAAELAGVQRIPFEELLVQIGVATVRYDVEDYDQDIRGLAEARRRSQQ
jgi:predicted HTH domain antitoxin